MYLQNKAVCLCKCKQGKAHVFIATAMSCSRWNLLRIFIRYVALYIFKNVRKIFLKVKEKRKKWQEFLKNAKKCFVHLWRTLSVWLSSTRLVVVVFVAAVTVCSAACIATVRASTVFNWAECTSFVWTVNRCWTLTGTPDLINLFQMSDIRRLITVSIGFDALVEFSPIAVTSSYHCKCTMLYF